MKQLSSNIVNIFPPYEFSPRQDSYNSEIQNFITFKDYSLPSFYKSVLLADHKCSIWTQKLFVYFIFVKQHEW